VGHVQHGIPLELARRLIKGRELEVAVETGTFKGDTARDLAQLVPQVWSIEIDDDHFSEAVETFRLDSRVRVEHGGSPAVLKRIAGQISGPALFWLDAHCLPSSDPDVSSTAYCPALEEIEAIRSFAGANASCILLDDARLFLGPNAWYPTAKWPTLLEVIDALRVGADRYITVLDDVIIAVPMEARTIVNEWWMALSIERSGSELHRHLLNQALEPSPLVASKRLIRSLMPRSALEAIARHRSSQVD
jgi:hypothetical protein